MANNNKAEKTKMNSDLVEIVKILNGKFESEDWAEMAEPNLAFFPTGQLWVCDGCDEIRVGFYVNTMPDMVGKMALALAKYESRLRIESLPVYVDEDENFFEGEEAFTEFGKMLIGAFACDDGTIEVVNAIKTAKPNKRVLQ